jgi:hypothetical protein
MELLLQMQTRNLAWLYNIITSQCWRNFNKQNKQRQEEPNFAFTFKGNIVQKTLPINWKHIEVFTLVEAKKHEHIHVLDEVDPCDQFQTRMTKWKEVVTCVMKTRCFQYVKNGLVCKYRRPRWTLSTDFDNLFNYMVGTNHNKDYQPLNLQKKITWHLPRQYGHGMCDKMHCRNPTLRQVWGWDSHSQKWEFGVLRDSCNFRAR